MFQYVGRYMMSRGGLDTSYVVDVVVCAKPPLRTGALPVYRVEYQRFRFSFKHHAKYHHHCDHDLPHNHTIDLFAITKIGRLNILRYRIILVS